MGSTRRNWLNSRDRSRTPQSLCLWTTAVAWTWTLLLLKCVLSMRPSPTAAVQRPRRGMRPSSRQCRLPPPRMERTFATPSLRSLNSTAASKQSNSLFFPSLPPPYPPPSSTSTPTDHPDKAHPTPHHHIRITLLRELEFTNTKNTPTRGREIIYQNVTGSRDMSLVFPPSFSQPGCFCCCCWMCCCVDKK